MTTLLEVVQDLLSATSGEEVNSIFDTVESEQYARAVKDCYEVLLATLDLPERTGLFELESSGTSLKPVLMSLPSTAESMQWLKYDCRTVDDTSSVMSDLKYVPLETFLNMSYSLDLSDSDVSSFDTTINNATVEVRYRTDRAPTYYTTYDETYLLFDAYDSQVEVTLQKSKTLAYGKLTYDFSLLDNFVIPLAKDQVVLLKQEAKTQVFSEFKQVDNANSVRKARELKVVTAINKNRIKDYRRPYSNGRRSVKTGR